MDTSGKAHGFIRCFDGRITVFDVPGSLETKPFSINETGEITGDYLVSQIYYGEHLAVPQGFIRDRDGKITTFGAIADFPVEDFSPQPVAITRHGEVVGNFSDWAGGYEAFIRSATGTIQTFTLNDAAAYSTFLTALNGHGDVVGYGGSDNLDTAGGFLWNGTGSVPPSASTKEIDYPGSAGTFPTVITTKGGKTEGFVALP